MHSPIPSSSFPFRTGRRASQQKRLLSCSSILNMLRTAYRPCAGFPINADWVLPMLLPCCALDRSTNVNSNCIKDHTFSTDLYASYKVIIYCFRWSTLTEHISTVFWAGSTVPVSSMRLSIRIICLAPEEILIPNKHIIHMLLGLRGQVITQWHSAWHTYWFLLCHSIFLPALPAFPLFICKYQIPS